MDPLPFYYEPLENESINRSEYPYSALTQRPMAMYHSWDSQNAWLRQIHAHNYLHVHPSVGKNNGFEDGDWVWAESVHGKIKVQCHFTEAVSPDTVWTWNAIGKASGAWALSKQANESKRGFLLNHLIGEELPNQEEESHLSNSDPITGQAAWYDVRVKIYKADAGEAKETSPQFKTMETYPGMTKPAGKWLSFKAGEGRFKRMFGRKSA